MLEKRKTMSQEVIRLDVEGAVKEKLKGRYIPKLFLLWLKHIIHEDTFNEFFAKHPDLKDYEFIREVIGPNLLNVSVFNQGIENLPDDDEPVIFVSNHPLGGLDGMILALLLGDYRNYNVKVIVNDLLMHLKPLQGIFVPVNIYGGQSRDAAKYLSDVYKSDYDILTFPAGACSRKIDGKVQDMTWKKSFIQKAIESKRKVVPIHFEGQNSRFFYNLALWRKKLGIKFNIELLFLPNEMFKAAGQLFTVKIGKPIDYTTFDSSRTPQQWAQWVREQCYAL